MSVIFRRIGGRVVRIVIGSEKATHSAPGYAARKIVAVAHDGAKETVGQMKLTVAPTKTAFLDNVVVEDGYREQGLSKAMFEHAQKLMGRVNKKFIRSDWILHEAQVKIRQQAGKTSFVLRKEGKDGRLVGKKISGSEALKAAEEIRHKGSLAESVLRATTQIPKKFRIKKGNQ